MLLPQVVSSPMRAISVSDRDSRKSIDPLWYVSTKGSLCVVTVSDAVCERASLLAETVTEDDPTVAVAGIEKVSASLAPASIENGVDGDVVTPAGSPSIAICTGPEKPSPGLMETNTGAVELPTTANVVSGETDRSKSSPGVVGPSSLPEQAPTRVARQAVARSA